ncbi:ABC transporter permease [Actinoallomurus iriomotensis]|uniref:Peptide ABC transporter permease n=1 Tax=Actinoallomurus iriomotensis TaxID=478107 RepID=A0A9W6RAY9_9ACTN|nr:ABC transporter permease [Actinoallomurus iriomotensis]GLY72284.1 peptide ABC transporter permease [Actinoallomurus iriomotensis]
MLRFLIRRVLSGVLVMWLVTTVVFILFFATSRDPAARFAGKSATPATLALLRHRMGLDEPLPLQYWHFVTRLLSGDLGYSYATHSPVGEMVKDAVPVTLSVVVGAATLWLITGVVAGVISATRARSAMDRGVTVLVIVGMSVPAFVTASTLLFLLAFSLPVFPLGGYVPLHADPAGWLQHLILPWITGAIVQAAFYTRLTRGSLLDVLDEDYVRTARAKGLGERRVVYRHGLRSALAPVVTQFGMDLGSALSGASVVETVFGLQGIGQLTVRSMTLGDLPVIMAVVLLAAFGIVVASIVVDVVYALLDPRVRLT